MITRAYTLIALLILSACQAAPPDTGSSDGEVSAQSIIQRAEAADTIPPETCNRLGNFAIVVTEGRQEGVSRSEALTNAQAGPLTPVLRSIVRSVYQAPKPSDVIGWIELADTVAGQTRRTCLAANNGAT